MNIYGVCSNFSISNNEINLMKDVGVNAIRGGIGDANWSILMGRSDISTIGLLSTNSIASGFTLSQWENVVRTAVSGYPQVKVWDIWNEPTEGAFRVKLANDIYTYPHSYEANDPVAYMNLLKTAYNVIQQQMVLDGIQRIVIGLGGLRVFVSNKPNSIHPDITFFQTCVSLGALNFCDAIAIHVYPSYSGDYRVAFPSINTHFQRYNNIMATAGKLKEIWVTEWGCEMAWIPIGLTKKDFIRDTYSIIVQYSTKSFYYKLRDTPTESNDPYHGLLDQYSQPKNPDYLAYKIHVSMSIYKKVIASFMKIEETK